MAIPDYQSIMLPLLRLVGNEKEHSLRDSIDTLAVKFNLSDEDRKELLPSGQQATFNNRVGWARTYMKKSGLVESTRRGYFRITERGLEVLRQNPPKIDTAFLRQYPEFVEFQTPRQGAKDEGIDQDTVETQQTPEEEIEAVYWEDLMPECLWQIRYKGLGPLTVAIDSHGNNLYGDVNNQVNNKRQRLYAQLGITKKTDGA